MDRHVTTSNGRLWAPCKFRAVWNCGPCCAHHVFATFSCIARYPNKSRPSTWRVEAHRVQTCRSVQFGFIWWRFCHSSNFCAVGVSPVRTLKRQFGNDLFRRRNVVGSVFATGCQNFSTHWISAHHGVHAYSRQRVIDRSGTRTKCVDRNDIVYCARLALTNGCASTHQLRNGRSVTTRARSRCQHYQCSSQSGFSTSTNCRRMDARSIQLRLATTHLCSTKNYL